MPTHKFFVVSARLTAVSLLVLLLPTEATALEWSASPSVSTTVNANDNVNLIENPDKTVWDYSVSPQLVLSVSAPTWNLSGRGRIDRLEYPNASELSRTSYFLDSTATRQYEHSQFAINVSLVRDSILETELQTTGEVPVNVPANTQRSSRGVSPSWTWHITELDDVSFAYAYQNVSYSNVIANSVLDYVTKEPSVTLTHALSEKNRVSLSLDYSDYETQNPVSVFNHRSRSKTTSAQVGFSRVFSPTLSGSVMAGMHRTDSTIEFIECILVSSECFFPTLPAEVNSTSTGSLFSMSLQKSFESSQLTAGLSRSLEPTGGGGLLQTDHVGASYKAQISSTLSGSLDLSVSSSQSSSSSSGTPRSRYYTISPAVAWQITELWTASTSYVRSTVQRSSGPQISGNAINLTLSYNFPKISRSR